MNNYEAYLNNVLYYFVEKYNFDEKILYLYCYEYDIINNAYKIFCKTEKQEFDIMLPNKLHVSSFNFEGVIYEEIKRKTRLRYRKYKKGK